jgi:hypothetical protein
MALPTVRMEAEPDPEDDEAPEAAATSQTSGTTLGRATGERPLPTLPPRPRARWPWLAAFTIAISAGAAIGVYMRATKRPALGGPDTVVPSDAAKTAVTPIDAGVAATLSIDARVRAASPPIDAPTSDAPVDAAVRTHAHGKGTGKSGGKNTGSGGGKNAGSGSNTEDLGDSWK